VGNAVVLIGALIPLLFMVIVLALHLWTYQKDKVAILEINPTYVHVIDRALVRNVEGQTKAIVAEAEQRYPPNASGFSRILPWNWSVEPVMPEGNVMAYNAINKCASSGWNDPFKLRDSLRELNGIPTLVSRENVEGLQEAVKSLDRNLPALQSQRYVIVFSDFIVYMFLGMFPFFGVFFIYSKRMRLRRSVLLQKRARQPSSRLVSSPYLMLGVISLEFFILIPRGNAIEPFRVALLLGFSAWIILGLFIKAFRWPRNPLLAVVGEVLPPRDTNGVNDDMAPSKANQEDPLD
jgi:hypothetical protein